MAIIAECEQCLTEYDAKRSTSRFCSPKCKQTFYRNRIKPAVTDNVTVTPESVTLSAEPDVTVTQSDGYSSRGVSGKCWCCGDDTHPGLVCCGPCAWSGRAKEKRAGRYPPLLTDRTPAQMETDLHSL